MPRMQEFLDAGYTTLMSGGGPVPGIIELKRRVDSGALKGPRIITSGRVDPDNFKTEELARAQVRKYAEAGIEIIKARIDPEPTPQQLSILEGRRGRREEAQARHDGARRQRAGDARRARGGRAEACAHAARQLAERSRRAQGGGRRCRDAVNRGLRTAGVRRLQQGQHPDVPRRRQVAGCDPRRQGPWTRGGGEGGERAHALGCGRDLRLRH